MVIEDIFKRENSKTFIIAEISANHGGDLETAVKTIKYAKKAGADAIKLQTYTADTITLNCNKNDFIIKGTIWENKKLYDLYEEAHTPWDWHEKLFQVAEDEGLICFSSPFDLTAVDFLESLGNPIYKIASFEITDIPLIKKVSETRKPIIFSSGIASEEDISLALETCNYKNNKNIAILQCTSSYPADPKDANLSSIEYFRKKFNVIGGLSDHSPGWQIPFLSVGLGSKIIEKHFILDRSIGGPDASFSLDFKSFKEMVEMVRYAEKIVGKEEIIYDEKKVNSKNFSKSIYASSNIKKGDVFNTNNIKVVRPGFGIHPKYFDKIIGKKSKCSYEFGDRINLLEIL